MARFIFANGGGGFRAINLDLVRHATHVDGETHLHFSNDDVVTVTGKDAEVCWEAINELWREGGRMGVEPESRTARPPVKAAPMVSNYSGTIAARRMRRP